MSIKEQIIEIIAEQLGADKKEVEESKSFVEDLDADSLDLTRLMMTFEEKFHCEIPEQEAMKLKTVGDVIRYIENRPKV